MLILTRKVNQAIIIDGRIRISVLEVEGDKIKLGIDAPREVPIVREELYRAVEEENIEASRAKPENMSQIGKLPVPKKETNKD